LKCFVAYALDARFVKEHVLSGRRFDEAETLVRQPFDFSVFHVSSFPRQIDKKTSSTRFRGELGAVVGTIRHR
jgi:hypothetical protein